MVFRVAVSQITASPTACRCDELSVRAEGDIRLT